MPDVDRQALLTVSKQATRQRAAQLPDGVWDCARCGATDALELRSSSLNRNVYADDIRFKCMDCWATPVHGVPFQDLDAYEREAARREHLGVVDFAEDGRDVVGQLDALGYTAKASDLQ